MVPELKPYESALNLKKVTTLIIASPKGTFTSNEISQITQFVADGSSLIINGRLDGVSSLNPLLSKFGLQLTEHNILSTHMAWDIGSRAQTGLLLTRIGENNRRIHNSILNRHTVV